MMWLVENHFMENDPERLAFAQQAQLDYTHFLQHRSRELVQVGVLILVIPSFNPAQHGPSPTVTTRSTRLLYACAQVLLTPEELLGYTIPIHHRSLDDYLDHSLFTRCSLQLIKAEQIISKNPWTEQLQHGAIAIDEYARVRTWIMRSWSGSILEQALVHNIQRHTIISQFEEIIRSYYALQPVFQWTDLFS